MFGVGSTGTKAPLRSSKKSCIERIFLALKKRGLISVNTRVEK
jgi:hypothetical protein